MIEPFYPKPEEVGRPPAHAVPTLSETVVQSVGSVGERGAVHSCVMRQFVWIDLDQEPVPDETTICKFRHLLEAH